MTAATRWAWAEIDLEAIEHNVRVIRERVAPSAVWAVVKADGYGHGAVDVSRAAIAGGAEGLAVALVDEGIELREAGIEGPILLLSEQPPDTAGHIVDNRLTPTVYTTDFVDSLAAAGARGLPVHLKIDTGMHRVGAHPDDARALVTAIAGHGDRLRLAGILTHLAVADDPTDDFTREQLRVFDAVLSELPAEARDDVLIHAANSAGALAHPNARRSFVRAGIAIYGISPGPGVAEHAVELRPAMTVRTLVSHVKRVPLGSRVSYGLRHRFGSDTTLVTIPVGYADGVPRRLSEVGGEVLIGGRRRPIVGAVTMDQLMVDAGDDDIRVGEEVVLIGEQAGPGGTDRIRAEEWADRLGTIGYEIVCGISARMPRVPRTPGAPGRNIEP